ncbi:MAG TPA: hypothetical protein VLZ89_10555 [Anaerolineales bacterium]|nr:hypothetical protein [Anaerolineales bacterium]
MPGKIDRAGLLHRLDLDPRHVEELNAAIFRPNLPAFSELLDIVEKYGTPDEINARAREAGKLPNLEARVAQIRPEYLADLRWLHQQVETGSFIRIAEYRRKITDATVFNEENPVTLEISACQYFPWLMDIARRAVENGEIMPGRYIRVRNMKEQEADGDLPAFAAAMQIIGASHVEQLDTRGSDGSNIHLGGADTLIGYYGGVGEPNQHALQWLDEFLYYYTTYGVRQILNVNSGTILLAHMLYRLGVDIEFKISVTLGNDNPYAALWTLLTAALFTRPDGSTALKGLNWSNSVNAGTIENAAGLRKALDLEEQVRFEHHVTETWKGLVIQPYDRRAEVLALARAVHNVSAKHEGGEVEVERSRPRPSDVQDYYREKSEIIASGEWEALRRNFLDKCDSVNITARALTERGLSFVAARNLHR